MAKKLQQNLFAKLFKVGLGALNQNLPLTVVVFFRTNSEKNLKLNQSLKIGDKRAGRISGNSNLCRMWGVDATSVGNLQRGGNLSQLKIERKENDLRISCESAVRNIRRGPSD